jgi:predicted porin
MKIVQLSLLVTTALTQAAWAQSALSVYGMHDAGLLLDSPCARCSVFPLRLVAEYDVQPSQPAWARPRFDDGNRDYGVSVGATAGLVTFRVAHQNKAAVSIDRTTLLGNASAARNTIVAANMGFFGGTVYTAYSVNRGSRNSPFWNPSNPYAAALPMPSSGNSRDMLLGMAYPVGATTFLAAFVRKNDRELINRDLDQLAIGASYALTRKTDVYTAFSHSRPRSNIKGAMAGDAQIGSMLNIGLRHGF